MAVMGCAENTQEPIIQQFKKPNTICGYIILIKNGLMHEKYSTLFLFLLSDIFQIFAMSNLKNNKNILILSFTD